MVYFSIAVIWYATLLSRCNDTVLWSTTAHRFTDALMLENLLKHNHKIRKSEIREKGCLQVYALARYAYTFGYVTQCDVIGLLLS